MTETRSRPWWELVVGAVIVIALLAGVGGWALPLVLAAVVAMVALHELGHFVTAKKSGMRVNSYFIGFGPTLWSTTRGETTYGVKAFLLGGFVKIVGMTSIEEVDEADEPRSFRASTFPRRVMVASAGSAVHFILALTLAWSSLFFIGSTDPTHVGIGSFVHWDGVTANAAQQAGLRIGDRVLSVNGRDISDPAALANIIHAAAGKELLIRVARGSSVLALRARPVDGRHIVVKGQHLESPTLPTGHGYLGIGISEQMVGKSAWSATTGSLRLVGSTFSQSITSLGQTFSLTGFSNLWRQVASPEQTTAKEQASRPQSLVGVVRVAVQSADAGIYNLLYVLMALNIFVGVINLLPMLPLDGGHIAIAIYERIRSRRGRERYRADITKMMPVVYVFMAALMFLFLTSLYLDIAHPMGNPFK